MASSARWRRSARHGNPPAVAPERQGRPAMSGLVMSARTAGPAASVAARKPPAAARNCLVRARIATKLSLREKYFRFMFSRHGYRLASEVTENGLSRPIIGLPDERFFGFRDLALGE